MTELLQRSTSDRRFGRLFGSRIAYCRAKGAYALNSREDFLGVVSKCSGPSHERISAEFFRKNKQCEFSERFQIPIRNKTPERTCPFCVLEQDILVLDSDL